MSTSHGTTHPAGRLGIHLDHLALQLSAYQVCLSELSMQITSFVRLVSPLFSPRSAAATPRHRTTSTAATIGPVLRQAHCLLARARLQGHWARGSGFCVEREGHHRVFSTASSAESCAEARYNVMAEPA